VEVKHNGFWIGGIIGAALILVTLSGVMLAAHEWAPEPVTMIVHDTRYLGQDEVLVPYNQLIATSQALSKCRDSNKDWAKKNPVG
jgi:hypothetical protein